MSRLGTGSGPFLVEEGVENTENNGAETFQIWKGSAAEVSAKRFQLIAAGATRVRYESSQDGDYIVRASWPYDVDNPSAATFVDTLELETNLIQRSVYQSPVYRSKFSDYNSLTRYSTKSNNTLPIIAKAHQLLQNLQPSIVKTTVNGTQTLEVPKVGYSLIRIGATTPTIYNTAEAAVHDYFYDRMFYLGLTAGELAAATNFFIEVAFMGVTSFWEYNTVFRRTVTAAVPSAVSANFAGAGMIWTSDEVATFENVPTSGGWFSLPANKQWIKDKPRVLKAYGQKTQLTYCYTEIVTASGLLYEPYGTAILIHS